MERHDIKFKTTLPIYRSTRRGHWAGNFDSFSFTILKLLRNRTRLFRSSYSSQIHLALNNLLDYSFKLYTLNMNTIYLLTIFDVSCNVGCHIYSEFPVCNNEPDAKRFSPPPFSFTRRDARMKMKRGGGSNWHSTRFRLLITYTQ